MYQCGKYLQILYWSLQSVHATTFFSNCSQSVDTVVRTFEAFAVYLSLYGICYRESSRLTSTSNTWCTQTGKPRARGQSEDFRAPNVKVKKAESQGRTC